MEILIVEDDVPIRDMIQLIAESAFPDAEMHAVGTGGEALAYALTRRPELVLLDLGLPDMSGFDVLEALNRSGRTSKVVMITAEDLPDRRARAAQMQVDAFVPKPFDARRLRELLRRVAVQSPALNVLGVFA